MAHEANNARTDSAQPVNDNCCDGPFGCDICAPIEEKFSLSSMDLPDYRALFRIEAWLNNTLMGWPWDLSDPPEAITDLDSAIGCFVEAALAKEGLTHGQMLQAIHAGRFDRG